MHKYALLLLDLRKVRLIGFLRMKISSKTKPRIVAYVSPEEMKALRRRAARIGLRTPHQVVGMWIRQHLAAKE